MHPALVALAEALLSLVQIDALVRLLSLMVPHCVLSS